MINQRVAIGVDVGGTKIAAAGVDINTGELLVRDEIPTCGHEGGERVLERLYVLVGKIHSELDKRGIQSLGVGLGIPELVNNDGVIKSHWHFDWDQRNVNDRLAEFGPVILESDVRTATLAENVFGQGKTYTSFIYINIGSGLSFAFCNDNQIHRGANGYAIHFGSSDIISVCDTCGTQGSFNLEAFASGHGLSETFRLRTGNVTNTKDLFNDADQHVAVLLNQATATMASYIAQLVNIFDPHAVIVGGGLGLAPRFFKQLQERVRPHIWAEDCRSIPFVASAISESCALIGAAVLLD